MKKKNKKDDIDVSIHSVFRSGTRKRSSEPVHPGRSYSHRNSESTTALSSVKNGYDYAKSNWDIKFTKKSYFKSRHKIDVPHVRLAKLVLGLIIVLRYQRKVRQATIIKRMEKLRLNFFENNDQIDTEELLYETSLFYDIIKLHSKLIVRDEYEDYYPLELEEKFHMEGIFKESKLYKAGSYHRYFFIFRKLFLYLCDKILNNIAFSLLTYLMLVLYCWTKVYIKDKEKESFLFNVLLVFYSLEVLLKMVVYGLINDRGEGFLQNSWNKFDLSILILTFTFTKNLTDFGVNFLFIKLIKLLNILKFKTLQIVVTSISVSTPLLLESFLILFLSLFTWAVMGLQMFSGALKNMCFNPETGIVHEKKLNCGIYSCPNEFVCGHLIDNSHPISNFDDIGGSFMKVLRVVTLNQWIYTMNLFQKTITYYSWIYFLILVVIGNFYLLNLVLVILKIKFTESSEKLRNMEESREDLDFLLTGRRRPLHNLKELRDKDLYNSKRIQLWRLSKPKQKTTQGGLIPLLMIQGGPVDFDTTLINKRQNEKKFSKKNSLNYSRTRSFIENNGRNIFYWFIDLFKMMKANALMVLLESQREGKKPDWWKKINPFDLRPVVKKKQNYVCLNGRDVLIYERKKKKILDAKPLSRRGRNVDYYVEITKAYTDINPIFHNKTAQIPDILTKNQIWELGEEYLEHKKIIRRLPLKHPYKLLSEINPGGFYREAKNKSHHSGKHAVKTSKLLYTLVLKIGLKNDLIKIKAEETTESSLLPSGPEKLVSQEDEEENENEFSDNEEIDMEFTNVQNLIYREIKNKTKPFPDPVLSYDQIEENDKLDGKKIKKIWSGKSVLIDYKFLKLRATLKALSLNYKELFTRGSELWKVILHKKLKQTLRSTHYKYFVYGIIILSTTSLALQESYFKNSFTTIYIITLILFTFDLVVNIKLHGLSRLWKFGGFKLEIMILSLNYLDLVSKTLLNMNKYSSLRIIQSLYSVRFLRLLERFQYAEFILIVLKKTFFSFISMATVLFIVMIIYSFVGNDLFADKLPEKIINFDSFGTSFLLVFRIVTLDNWYLVFEIVAQRQNYITTIIYFISCIMIGNLLLLKLFLAILLDGFEVTAAAKIEEMLIENQQLSNKESQKKKNKLMDKLNSFDWLIKKKSKSLDDSPSENKEKRPKHSTASVQSHNKSSRISLKSLMTLMIQPAGSHDVEYSDILEPYSLFLFSKRSRVRRLCFRIMKSKLFKKLQILGILIATARIAYDTTLNWQDSNVQKVEKQFSYKLKLVLNIFFSIDTVMGIISYGLVMRKGSFLRGILNCVDFIFAIAFVIDIILKNDTIYIFKMINLLKIIKLIKLLYKFQNSKIIILSIIESLAQVAQVLVIVLAVWLVFAITGNYMFQGRFGYCESLITYDISSKQCAPGIWKNHKINFDSIYNSFITLVVLGTMDNWVEGIESIAVNANIDTEGPKYLGNLYSAALYFYIFMFVGNFLFLGLLIGVLFSNFALVQKRYHYADLSTGQSRWIEMSKFIQTVKPFGFVLPRIGPKKRIIDLLSSPRVKNIYSAFMMLDMLHQAIYFDNSSKNYMRTLLIISCFIDIAYLAELFLKLYSYGIQGFFSKKIFRYEFFCACLYTSSLIIEISLSGGFDSLSEDLKIYSRIMKVLRTCTLFRLLMKFRQINNFLSNLLYSMPILISMTVLFCIFLFIYGVCGCFLFGQHKRGEILDDYNNFQDIYSAMWILFRCVTANDWILIMIDYQEVSQFAHLFFVSFTVIGNFILLNLYILIIFQSFEEFFKTTINIVDFQMQVEQMNTAWSIFCADDKNQAVQVTKILKFFFYLGPPLGIPKSATFNQIGKFLAHMTLRSDKEGLIDFHETLYLILKNLYREQLFTEESSEKSLELLAASEALFFEKSNQRRIQKRLSKIKEDGGVMKPRGRNFDRGFSVRESIANLQNHLKQGKKKKKTTKIDLTLKSNNLLYIFLTNAIIFRTWRNYTHDNIDERKSSNTKTVDQSQDSGALLIPIIKNIGNLFKRSSWMGPRKKSNASSPANAFKVRNSVSNKVPATPIKKLKESPPDISVNMTSSFNQNQNDEIQKENTFEQKDEGPGIINNWEKSFLNSTIYNGEMIPNAISDNE